MRRQPLFSSRLREFIVAIVFFVVVTVLITFLGKLVPDLKGGEVQTLSNGVLKAVDVIRDITGIITTWSMALLVATALSIKSFLDGKSRIDAPEAVLLILVIVSSLVSMASGLLLMRTLALAVYDGVFQLEKGSVISSCLSFQYYSMLISTALLGSYYILAWLRVHRESCQPVPGEQHCEPTSQQE